MQLSLVLMTLRRAQADTEMTLQPGQARAEMRRHRRMLAYLSRTQTTRLALAALQVAQLLVPAALKESNLLRRRGGEVVLPQKFAGTMIQMLSWPHLMRIAC